MKTIRKVWLALTLLGSAAAPATTIEMEVHGLVCAFCAQGIEKTLKAFPQTAEVLVSLEHRLVAVVLRDKEGIADEQLRTAITDAGYALVGIRRSERALADIRADLAATEEKRDD